MDVLPVAIVLLSLLSVLAYGFVAYQVLRVFVSWASWRWRDDWGKRPLILRVPSPVLTVLLVLVFVAVVL